MDDFDIFINKLFKRHLQKKPYKKCFINNCNNIGSYNFFNKITNHYCKTHKLPNMLKIGNKRCLDCLKIPLIINLKKPLFTVMTIVSTT